eukprot:COSAG05_NODE_5348_length_1200_cov_1.888283_2_plen_129_part_00
MQQQPSSPMQQMVPIQQPVTAGMQGSYADPSTMVERLVEQQRALMREQRECEEAKMAKVEAKLEAKEQQLNELRTALTPKPPPEAITEEQLTALQARLTGLHVAKLLADEVRKRIRHYTVTLSRGLLS